MTDPLHSPNRALENAPCPICQRDPDEHNAAEAYRCLELIALAREVANHGG